MNELFNQIPELITKALQQQLMVPRPSRAYNGQKKPINSTGYYPPTPAYASGELYRNIDAFWRENQSGDMQLIVEMPDYWLWVNDGRRPGRYPPLSVIDRWSIQKGLTGIRDEKGRFIPRKTVNFLRARSIARYGFKGNNFVDKALKQVEDEVLKKFGEAALAYVQDTLENNLKFTQQGVEINVAL